MYRSFSEIDLVQIKSLEDNVVLNKDIQKMELELLTTPFKNRSILIQFLDNIDIFEAILEKLNNIDESDRRSADKIEKFYRRFQRILLMPIPNDVEDIN